MIAKNFIVILHVELSNIFLRAKIALIKVVHISTKITPYESKTWAISSAKQNCSLGLIFMSEERARTSTVAFLLACAVIDFRSTFCFNKN